MPWINRLEEEADFKLFGANAPSTVYTRINVNALLRGDQESRSKFYREMASLGVYSINDILEFEQLINESVSGLSEQQVKEVREFIEEHFGMLAVLAMHSHS